MLSNSLKTGDLDVVPLSVGVVGALTDGRSSLRGFLEGFDVGEREDVRFCTLVGRLLTAKWSLLVSASLLWQELLSWMGLARSGVYDIMAATRVRISSSSS